MNLIIVACTLFSLAAAAVIPEEAQAKIVQYNNDNNGDGNYDFSYETSNGISRMERGRLVNIGQDDEHLVVEGSYSFTDAEGNLVVVRYKADENGFQINPPETLPEIDISTQTISAVLPGSVVATLLG